MKLSAPSSAPPGLGRRVNERLRRVNERLRSVNERLRSGIQRDGIKRQGIEQRLGLGAEMRLLSAAIAVWGCLGIACSDDGPAQQTGVGGSTGSAEPDASVRDLPGDGREPTPDFDTESRQRYPVGPERLVETIGEIRDDLGLNGAPSEDGGLGAADPADGGAS